MKALVFTCATLLCPLALGSAASAQPAAPAPATGEVAPAPAAAAPVAPTAAADATPPAAAAATAAPAAAELAPVAPVVGGDTPTALKHTCMDAINSDQLWTNELSAMVQKKLRYDAHNSEAELIAMNKRHVVLAYAALWLIAVGFLFSQWRRQQALKRQIENLQRDLESAIKGPAA